MPGLNTPPDDVGTRRAEISSLVERVRFELVHAELCPSRIGHVYVCTCLVSDALEALDRLAVLANDREG